MSIGIAYHDDMNAIQTAAACFGSQAEFAQQLGVSQPTVSEWARGVRPVPIERAVEIESKTRGAVRRWDLRPDDWSRIWPELIGAEGAPPVVEQAA